MENQMEQPNQGEQKQNQPIVETQITKSKDGKYVLHITKIVDIKPTGYYQKVLENTGE